MDRERSRLRWYLVSSDGRSDEIDPPVRSNRYVAGVEVCCRVGVLTAGVGVKPAKIYDRQTDMCM